ncbi:NmrA family NAD(P)-binding protein [Natronoglycomyces albus]|uniref:NmrA family NAD(P)-binding protein n=1 Tax=Natronoglycomyces albus TaxID=2811108 RepID=A0A895XU64_9ACTN|nr:NmrA family NAD(P)-binding protein [Natronoglycomyces albus]QSB06066.1 NmrA family NAD(P)-binding protein [Natronoglycomyces albus]
MNQRSPHVLVLTGTGKTGRRTVSALRQRGIEPRLGSRRNDPAFDWHQPQTWGPALEGIDTVFVAIPDEHIEVEEFIDHATRCGVRKLVGLAGRRQHLLPKAPSSLLAAHVKASGLPWTMLEANNFNENFSEGIYRDEVLEGTIYATVGDTPEPFIALEDLGEVAAAVLSQPGHEGITYELSGPEAISFAQVAQILQSEIGSPVTYVDVDPQTYHAAVLAAGESEELADFLNDMYEVMRKGLISDVADGVGRVLDREAVTFADWARRAAKSGAWKQ